MASNEEGTTPRRAKGEGSEPFHIKLLPLANRLLGPTMTLTPTPGMSEVRRDGDADTRCEPGDICWNEDDGWHTGSGTGGEWVLIGLVLTAGTIAVIQELIRGALSINWENFGAPIPGGDHDLITLSETESTPDVLTVSLTIDPSIYWWKAVEVYAPGGQLLGAAWCKRNEGVTFNTTTVQGADLQGSGFIVFKKAKAFGVHTSMYVLRGIPSKIGRTLDFTWVAKD